MAPLPPDVTTPPFEQYFRPHLATADRGYERDQPLDKRFNLILYKLTTSCPWPKLPLERAAHDHPGMSSQVPYAHFRKWSKEGSLHRLCDASILPITGELHFSELNLDGSHSAAKKGAKPSPIKDARRPKPALSCR